MYKSYQHNLEFHYIHMNTMTFPPLLPRYTTLSLGCEYKLFVTVIYRLVEY